MLEPSEPEGVALDPVLHQKWQELVARLQGLEGAAVALSGGVDSSLLAVLAHRVLGSRMAAFTIRSPVEGEEGCQAAEELARQAGFAHIVIDHNDLDDPRFAANPPDRCYWCKLVRFRLIQERASRMGLAHLLEGSNADDAQDYRPGKKAALELGGLSPLAEAGLTKLQVRELARALGLSVWNRPSAPCLATRFPYGQPITREGLRVVDAAERFLRRLGFHDVRVRHHGALARIEVAPELVADLARQREPVISFLGRLGFRYVCLDLAGYRTGSMNEVLPASALES